MAAILRIWIHGGVVGRITAAVAVLLVTLACSARAQHRSPLTVVLKGHVQDHESENHIDNVSIQLIDSLSTIPIKQTTDVQGRFRVRLAPNTCYSLIVRRLGYTPDTITFISGRSDTALLIRLHPAIVRLAQIDASAWRERRIEESFQPATVLEGAALDRHLASSIAATIASQPGITQRYNGPMATQPVIRGLTGDRVLVLEDGLRTGDIATTAADHSVTIDPLTMRRIEVIRGPAGLLYGTSTLGGVVNVIRDDVPHIRPERLQFTLGSQFESVNRGTTASGELTLPLPWNITTRGELTARRGHETRTPAGFLPFTNLEAFDGSMGVGWMASAHTVGASIREYRTSYGVPSSFGGLTLPGSHAGGVYVDARRTTGRIEAESQSETRALRSVRTQANYVRFEQEELERSGFVGTRFGQLAASGEAIARYAHGSHSGAFGASLQGRDFRAVGSYTGTRPAKFNSRALFGFHEVSISPIRVMAGLRYDQVHLTPLDSTASALLPDIRSRKFGAFTWTFGTIYSATSSFTTGLNVARAFRAPAIEELYSAGPHLANYAYEIGNPSLAPETGTGGDAFIRYTTTRINAELSIFSNRIQNFIQYASLIDSATGLPLRDPRLRRYIVYQATQRNARLTGIEGSFAWEFHKSLTVDAVAHTLRGTDASGAPLPMMPPTRIRLGFHRNRPSWFIGGNAEMTFSQRRIPSTPTLGSCTLSNTTGETNLLPAEFCPTSGVTLFNTTAGYRWQTKTFVHAVTLSTDNIFNTLWRDPLWRAKQVAPQPGRNIRLLYRVGS